MLIRRSTVAVASMTVLLFSQAGAQSRDFASPTHEGMPISYCGSDSSSCGEPMATAWCQINGYDQATNWAARAGIDSSHRTIQLDSGVVCQGAACEAFGSITCRSNTQGFTLPTMGPNERSTVLTPNRRGTQASLDDTEYKVLIPGCSQVDPGVFRCKSLLEYQHCRTLMIGRLLYSCQAGLAFDEGIAEPRLAEAGAYSLEVESDARIRVSLGSRGQGQIRGEAEIHLLLDPPEEGDGSWCLQRDSYLYYPTGPAGGTSELGESEACDEPIELEFEPHADDLFRAYDLCDSFAAWGSEIEDTIGVLVGGLFHIRSNSPAFEARHGRGLAVIAPYLEIEAPVNIDCRT